MSLAVVECVPLDTAKIRRLRLKLGLTQEQAAARAGLRGRQAWSDVENGHRSNLQLSSLERIARALGCHARDLLK